ncbi:hypothetical protein CEXT_394961 [Caerostris extrusa]|uniref:Uncharacterized protein n=1 Tax=Caerostris extrusa TaxID=172846 RepID=A0AAV4XPP3_CAEEX|nr:hypothetical protein CEXT_394961 [Caerostris extrusa]
MLKYFQYKKVSLHSVVGSCNKFIHFPARARLPTPADICLSIKTSVKRNRNPRHPPPTSRRGISKMLQQLTSDDNGGPAGCRATPSYSIPPPYPAHRTTRRVTPTVGRERVVPKVHFPESRCVALQMTHRYVRLNEWMDGRRKEEKMHIREGIVYCTYFGLVQVHV